jgi:hypothetical protein
MMTCTRAVEAQEIDLRRPSRGNRVASICHGRGSRRGSHSVGVTGDCDAKLRGQIVTRIIHIPVTGPLMPHVWSMETRRGRTKPILSFGEDTQDMGDKSNPTACAQID